MCVFTLRICFVGSLNFLNKKVIYTLESSVRLLCVTELAHLSQNKGYFIVAIWSGQLHVAGLFHRTCKLPGPWFPMVSNLYSNTRYFCLHRDCLYVLNIRLSTQDQYGGLLSCEHESTANTIYPYNKIRGPKLVTRTMVYSGYPYIWPYSRCGLYKYRPLP